MKDPCSLGCISKSVVSRSREIIIPIHLRGIGPHLEDYTQDWLLSVRWVLKNCSIASRRAPQERAGGAGFDEERRSRGNLIAVCSYLKESCREDEAHQLTSISVFVQNWLRKLQFWEQRFAAYPSNSG